MLTTGTSQSNPSDEQALAIRFLPPLGRTTSTARRKLQSSVASTIPLAVFFNEAAAHKTPAAKFARLTKRLIDIVVSALGLIVVSPLLVLIIAIVKLSSTGPALYCAPRAGKNGRSFLCFKFRTMIDNADRLKADLRSRNQRQGPFFKMTSDPRITSVGKILRRYSLDEIPQLWNVLIGDMSLVGPRPHPLDDCQLYIPQDLRRLDVTPGITGLWQVTARRDSSFQRNMALDLEYIERWSLMMDARILFRTVSAVVRGTGA